MFGFLAAKRGAEHGAWVEGQAANLRDLAYAVAQQYGERIKSMMDSAAVGDYASTTAGSVPFLLEMLGGGGLAAPKGAGTVGLVSGYRGSKALSTRRLAKDLPQVDRWVEPFLGGGNALLEVGKAGKFKSALVAEKDPRLLSMYKTIKENGPSVAALAEDISKQLDRLSSPKKLIALNHLQSTLDQGDDVLKAAKLAVIGNRAQSYTTGAEKIVARGSKAVTPKGLRKKIETMSKILQKTEIEDDFRKVLQKTKEGDYVFLDPPYYQRTKRGYRGGWGEEEQEELNRWLSRPRKGIHGKVYQSPEGAKTLPKLPWQKLRSWEETAEF